MDELLKINLNNMNQKTYLWLCFVLIAGCNRYNSNLSLTATVSDSQKQSINEIFKEWDCTNTPGGSVAIVKGGKVVFIKGYGCADLEMSSPMTPRTKLYLASISKQFTGYCIARLIHEGKLSLDDDIRELLPELSLLNSHIRVRDLVYHKSGLRDYMGLMPLIGHNLNDYFSNDAVLNLLEHQKELNFPPGDKWEYSNTNYLLLGEIVNRVSGKTLKEYAENIIFNPLQMSNTFFVDSLETIVPNRAKSYRKNHDATYSNDPFLDVTVGHTGLYSTAEDMAKWLIHLGNMNNKEDPVFKLMLQTDTLNSGDEISYYSFGLFKSSGNALNYWHRGSLFGYKSIISYYPDKDFGLVMLGNVRQFNRRKYAREVMQLFYPEMNTTASYNQAVFSIEDSLINKRLHPDSGLLKKYTGHYIVQPMLMYVITQKDNSIFLSEWGENEMTELIYVSRNTFKDEENKILISFYQNNHSEIDSFAYQSKSINVTGIKVRPISSAQEMEMVGEYYNDELDISVTINRTMTGLVAQNFRLGDIQLIPTFNDEFRCDHDFFSYIRMYRNDNNLIEGFFLDGFSVSNIRFVKMSIQP